MSEVSPEQKIINRFMAKVMLKKLLKPTPCWIWIGAYNNKSPFFYLSGKMHTAHSVSYDVFIAGIGGDRQPGRAFRTCGHRPCVSPLHLELRMVPTYHGLFSQQLAQQTAWRKNPLNQSLEPFEEVTRLGMNYDRGATLNELQATFSRSRQLVIKHLLQLDLEPFGNEDMGPLHRDSFPRGEGETATLLTHLR